jgi:death-on-curing protein
MIHFLSADQVIAMHEELLEAYGGDEGGGHRGASYEGAEAAVQAVKNSYYESVEELAAAYAVYIVQGHVFMDGNKRAASAAMLTFLDANGGRTRLTKQQVTDLMFDLQVRVESGASPRTNDLVVWIAGQL